MVNTFRNIRNRCSTRRFRKRFRRLIKQSKFKSESIKFQKFSMIYSIASPPLNVTGDEGVAELFWMTVKEACNLFLKLSDLILKFLKNKSMSVLKPFAKFIISHPYFSTFTVFVSCALILLDHLAKKFGRKLRWYDRLLTIILSLLATWLLHMVIKAEAFKTIREWLKSILIHILLLLHNIHSSIGSAVKDQPSINETHSPKDGGFKVFFFFSLLTTLTVRYLLYLFKRRVVGDGPFSDGIIHILEVDLTNYHPKNMIAAR